MIAFTNIQLYIRYANIKVIYFIIILYYLLATQNFRSEGEDPSHYLTILYLLHEGEEEEEKDHNLKIKLEKSKTFLRP